MKITIRRIYELAQPDDGYRVLVDRLWPRGVKKEEAHLDLWEKELAPSTELRKWYGHQPEHWEEFRKLYRAELAENPYVMQFLNQNKDQEEITLLYANRDERYSHTVILREFLEEKLKAEKE